jgi:flagellar export protein FliJ
MKRFQFRLEKILQLRSRVERERAQALGRAMRAEQACREAVEEALSQLSRCNEQMAGSPEEVSTAGLLRNLGLTVEAAAQRLHLAERDHAEAVDERAEEQERFGQARIDRRVVERLREHQAAAHSLEASRHEQRELDGISGKPRNREDSAT